MAVTWILGRGSKVSYRNPVKIKPGRKEEERSRTNFIVFMMSVSRNVKLQAKVYCLKDKHLEETT